MKLKYTISEKATEDLEGIWVYTFENWSIEQADRYYNLIIDEIGFITNNFMSGKPMDYVREGYRASKVKSHLVFYKKTTDGKVEIVRVLHESMDIENRLRN